MYIYNFWDILCTLESRAFNTLVNGNRKYSHKEISELSFADNKRISVLATVSKFANDK